jgi:hypothetical protein
MSKHPKRPRDTNQLAKLVVDILTGQVEDREPDDSAGKPGGKSRTVSLVNILERLLLCGEYHPCLYGGGTPPNCDPGLSSLFSLIGFFFSWTREASKTGVGFRQQFDE